MSITCTFRIKFKSDFHVGSGRRGGPDVDSALLRDHNHAPLLRGTMLAGLLRDGLRELGEFNAMKSVCAETVVKTQDNPRITAAERLFGSSRLRKRWTYSSARLGRAAAPNTQTDWGAQAVARVRISPRMRRAETAKLFHEEEGDKRLEYIFTATCSSGEPQDQRDALLLVAAARMVRTIGSARRRGRGECEIFLEGAEGLNAQPSEPKSWTEHALDLFQKEWLDDSQPQEAPELSRVVQLDQEVLVQSDLTQAKRFRVFAYLDEPVIVARRSETANAFDGLSLIPGVTVLGALAERSASHLGLNSHYQSVQPDPRYLELFFRGGVSVSGLLPARFKEGKLTPAIPAPLALFTCENFPAFDADLTEQHPTHNALRDGEPKLCPKCGAKQEPVPGFLALGRAPTAVSVTKREEAHIKMNPATGRAQSGVLYEYIGIEAGQYFMGELECADEGTFETLCQWTGLKPVEGQDGDLYEFSEPIRFGKAARRGYGKTRLVLQAIPKEAVCWIGQPIERRVTDVSQPLTITLLTPAIVCDAFGRFYASFDEQWLADGLGLQKEHIALRPNFARAGEVDTFNGYRRMPRWRDQAITEGSAAAFTVTAEGLAQLRHRENKADGLPALQTTLARLERQGIGLRRAEGFGRIAFNHPIYDPVTIQDETASFEVSKLGLLEDTQASPLQVEADQLERWAGELDNLSKVSAKFNMVARALYLAQNKPATEILASLDALAKPQAKYLWNKEIPNRSQKEKLAPPDIEQIKKLVEQWSLEHASDSSLYARGIAMLAERVADKAEQDKAEQEKRKDGSK